MYVIERDTKESFGETMKRIVSSYVYHYNHKYQHFFFAHKEGIGPRTLSHITSVPYSVVQRATSGTFCSSGMLCEQLPNDEEFETYIDHTEYEKSPEY